ncbi:hypothetical protein DFH08DRAFT_813318 [Mycena albidolilacea]|uniref:Uncharacterized protein n=1 Tax=Mycena albidolilacea TaxID=1033008 RepID=A0AAD6ZST4_9AGAR|nr:hypothetical protein DFH08DRAFT_813318 [Mycena albidolilacea]
MNSDPKFKQKLAAWYDHIICQSFPKDTVPYKVTEGTPKQLPVLSRPLDPDAPDYERKRDQHHRDLCENTGLVHGHNATCFKHIPRHIQSLVNPDTDCRCQLPRPLVTETHFDDDDDLVIRCENGSLNGHNPTAKLCLGCNADLKQTASSSAAMAMVEYMGNYTIKLQFDTAIVFSALCTSIKALQNKPPQDVDGKVDNSEMTRKRELTGQQTASLSLGRKNNYTSDEYQEYWWSSMLRDIAHKVFTVDPENHSEPHVPLEATEELEDGAPDSDEVQRMIIPTDEDDGMMLLTLESINQAPENDYNNDSQEKKYSNLFNDMFYRPPELDSVCL